MQHKWPVHVDRLYCGLVAISFDLVASRYLHLEKRLLSLEGRGRSPYTVTTHRQKKGEEQLLLYHEPFNEGGLAYDSIRNSASEIIVGDSKRFDDIIDRFHKLPNLTRTLRTVWDFEGFATVTLRTHINQEVSRANSAGLSLQVQVQPEHQLLRLEFRTCDPDIVEEQLWFDLERRAKLALHGFGKGAKLEKALKSKAAAKRAGVDIIGSIGLRVPETVPSYELTILDGLAKFRESIRCISEAIGAPSYLDFSVDIENWEPALSHFFECARTLPRVWSHFATRAFPVNVDIFQTPSDPAHSRAYPLVTVESNDPTPKLLFQINLVHNKGRSFIECQVYEDKKWFDVIADFFGVPIDVWEGPIESRFGWYGDAGQGRVVRHEPSSSSASQRAPEPKIAYLVMPKNFGYDDEFFYPLKSRYAPPNGLFQSLEEAEAFAKKNLPVFIGDNMLSVYTSQSEDFDFDALPKPSQTQIRKLMEFDRDDDWREAFDDFELGSLTKSDAKNLLRLLQIEPYEIVSVEMEDRTFYDQLAHKIKSGKIDPDTRERIVELFRLVDEDEPE